MGKDYEKGKLVARVRRVLSYPFVYSRRRKMDFLKYFIPFVLVLMLVVGAFFFFGTSTGRACVFCQPGTAGRINYSNPTEQDINDIVFGGETVLFLPVGILTIFGLVVALLRVTATPKQRKIAKETGESGLGTSLYGR